MDLHLDLLGTLCTVTSHDPMAATRLRSLLGHFETRRSGSDAHALIERLSDAGAIALTFRGERYEGRRSPVLSRLVSQLTAAAIEGFGGFAVHAGVVALEGRSLVLAAPSGVGKSTMTAACLLRGFDYVSDEALCISDRSGDVLTFAKPLALGGPSAELLGLRRRRLDTKDLIPAVALGASVATGPLTVRHVVSLTRSNEEPHLLEELDRSSGIATLLHMSFNAHKDPAGALAAASQIARGARSWRLDVGDPRAAADQLYDLVAGDTSGRPRAGAG